MKIEPLLVSDNTGVLTLTELRVLSGLSRGAAMPLEDVITIGADFACDLILVDPDVNDRHATLTRGADGGLMLALLKPTQEEIRQKTASRQSVLEGQPFEVAGIRMIVCESDMPWDFALPVKAPEPLSAIELAVADGVAAGRLGPAAGLTSKPRQRISVVRIASWVGGALVAALIAGFAVWVLDREDAPLPRPAPVARHTYSDAEIQAIANAFALQLESIDIMAMKLVAGQQQLTVQGYVDRSAESRFETAVQQLRDGHPDLKVRLDLGGDGKSVLPFEVTAAVGGPNGSVLLADGQQLFVGAEEEGFKFLGLRGSCLDFVRVATQQKVSQCSDSNPRRR